ncbi:ABC transporter ATP-binding protein [Geminicoccus flavidas]|uniref:ABC transporter ATP-binding protein n=1 Tax=Geminicoccus flavidas TaxID=2506407 RepID=UPI00135C44CA|nr:ABC transporter ATP-binding protein [Geminicoccus flavidas]
MAEHDQEEIHATAPCHRGTLRELPGLRQRGDRAPGGLKGDGLAVRGLKVAFDRGPPVLDIARLDVANGEQVAITGPSGCGKTTLALALCGIQPVREGQVRWNGQDVASMAEGARDGWRRRHVGMIFQDFHLVPGMSVLRNVLAASYFAAWRPGPHVVARAAELLEECGVPAGRQDVASLSRGEQQRVAIARALLLDPPILIADEPTASLDAANARLVAGLLAEAARRQGATLIAVTHDPVLIGAMDRTVRMADGRVMEDGS